MQLNKFWVVLCNTIQFRICNHNTLRIARNTVPGFHLSSQVWGILLCVWLYVPLFTQGIQLQNETNKISLQTS